MDEPVYVPDCDPYVTTVHGCARCGGEHVDLAFTVFTDPIYWAMCPTLNEPILMCFMLKNAEVSPEPDSMSVALLFEGMTCSECEECAGCRSAVGGCDDHAPCSCASREG